MPELVVQPIHREKVIVISVFVARGEHSRARNVGARIDVALTAPPVLDDSGIMVGASNIRAQYHAEHCVARSVNWLNGR